MSSSPAASGRRRRRLTADELEAWRVFLRAHALLTRRLEADLVAEQGMSLASYDVLVTLVDAPARSLRMTELADRVLISRSGLTRLVDRLERDGLVRREPAPDDARGLLAVLTDTGYDRLRRASSTHLRGIDEYVVSRLTTGELLETGRVLGKLVDRLD
ncbi:MarR family winged helix-turn-helix transcriptional regulator [Vallicoccus soli]|uniref:MarR family winged helix-turn-helix transcriptional regulator n=1 Tax=Vallicoccus soli TaxID=2339232 RepID=UPI001C499AF0|nr:MarR family transcriptional regulator [Vallicoccus soli]